MKSRIGTLKYYFVGVLGVACLAITAFELLYGIPFRKCEAAKLWWSWKYRECAAPLYLPTLTGRPVTADGKKSVSVDWHEGQAAADAASSQ